MDLLAGSGRSPLAGSPTKRKSSLAPLSPTLPTPGPQKLAGTGLGAAGHVHVHAAPPHAATHARVPAAGNLGGLAALQLVAIDAPCAADADGRSQPQQAHTRRVGTSHAMAPVTGGGCPPGRVGHDFAQGGAGALALGPGGGGPAFAPTGVRRHTRVGQQQEGMVALDTGP